MEPNGPTAQTIFEQRLTARLSVGFTVDVLTAASEMASVFDALLMRAVLQANHSRMFREERYRGERTRLQITDADQQLVPVSINALAVSLNQPFETVRRHVGAMARQNLLMVTPSGVYIPHPVLSSSTFIQIVRRQYALFWEFYRDLREANLVEDIGYEPLPGDDPRAPQRAISALITDFLFRTLDLLQPATRDPITALVFLGVARANSEHLPLATAEALMRSGSDLETQRRPVRVADLARNLGLAYETTRRRVGWLVEHGFCRASDTGVELRPSLMRHPQVRQAVEANRGNVQRLFRRAAELEPN